MFYVFVITIGDTKLEANVYCFKTNVKYNFILGLH